MNRSMLVATAILGAWMNGGAVLAQPHGAVDTEEARQPDPETDWLVKQADGTYAVHKADWLDVKANGAVAIPLFEPPADGEDLEFNYSIGGVGSGELNTVRGIVVSPEFWQAVVRTGNRKGSRSCSSTLVGKSVLLTAAHCIDAKDSNQKTATRKIHFRYGLDDVTGNCEMHEDYSEVNPPSELSRRSAFDFALCKLNDFEISDPSFIFETIDTEKRSFNGSEPLLVTGFGCTEILYDRVLGLKTNKSDGRYRVGSAKARAKASNADPELKTVMDPTVAGAAGLCPGDSGGPLFLVDPTKSVEDVRILIGVNSKVDAKPTATGKQYDIVSYFAATTIDGFHEWAKGWAGRNKVTHLCGVLTKANTNQCK